MSMVLKVTAIIVAVVFAIGVVGSLMFIGYNVGKYMINQHADFKTASDMAIKDYEYFMDGLIGKEKEVTQILVYDMANQNIDIVGCIDL